MTKIYSLFCILFLSCTSHAQQKESILLKNEPVVNLIDSINHKSLIREIDGVRKWSKSFAYIDSLQINEITYWSDSLRVNGYIVQPKKLGKYPCIIWNRGGVKEYGALSLIRVSAMLGKLASKGYVVIATQYRGNGGSEGQEEYGGAEINDVLNLFNVLDELPTADTSKIGMFGGSRGGMMTYIALTKTDRIKTAAVLAAPSDEKQSITDRPSMENSFFELVPNYEQNKEIELNKRSAVKWVDKFPKNVPILIIHGNADWRVKSSQSLKLALKLDEARIPYRLVIFEGADHGISEFRRAYYNTLIMWFDAYLKQGIKLPNMRYHGR